MAAVQPSAKVTRRWPRTPLSKCRLAGRRLVPARGRGERCLLTCRLFALHLDWTRPAEPLAGGHDSNMAWITLNIAHVRHPASVQGERAIIDEGEWGTGRGVDQWRTDINTESCKVVPLCLVALAESHLRRMGQDVQSPTVCESGFKIDWGNGSYL